MIEQAAFLTLTVLTLGAAGGVVASRTVVVSALWLVLSFVGVAGFYVLLGAGFLAATQVLIYVGAISVLILFAIMLTHDVMQEPQIINSQWAISLSVALGLFLVLAVVAFTADWPLTKASVPPPAGGVITSSEIASDGAEQADPVAAAFAEADAPAIAIMEADPSGGGSVARVPDQVTAIGRSLMSEHLLAFEVIGLVLLVALIGAIIIARQ